MKLGCRTILVLGIFSSGYNIASAQQAGSLVVSAGPAWIDFARSGTSEFQSSSAFGTVASPGASADAHNVWAPEFLFTYFVTDHIAIESSVGVPPKVNLFAHGNAAPLGSAGPTIPLANFSPLATTRAWAPLVLAKYYFGNASSTLRPFVGVGVNYTWFSSIQLNSGFSSGLQQLAGPGGHSEAKLSPSWNPVFTVGGTYRLNDRWSLLASATYSPLKTNAQFNSISQAGKVVLSNKTTITADPIIVFVGIGYRF